MDWGWIVIYGLAILGAALTVGGIVAYRGSRGAGIRSIAAMSIAGGAMMGLVVLPVVPASIGATGPGGPVAEGARFTVESGLK